MPSIRRVLKPRTSPADKITPSPMGPDAPVEEAIERCTVYVDGADDGQPHTYRSALEHVRREGRGWVWLGLLEPNERQMMEIAEAFNIHELIVEDAVNAHQRPKVERYDQQLFMVVRSVMFKEHESVNDASEIIETGEIQMILGPDFIITVRHGKPSNIKGLRRRVEEDPEQTALGPASVAWMIMDTAVDEYVRIGGELAADVDELEAEVFTPNERFDIQTIYMLKREILEMRHSIDPLAAALRLLLERNGDMLPGELVRYFRDVLDHELLAVDSVRGLDERLSALIDAGVAKITLQENDDMRKISSVAIMAAVPTVIAGIYGMNFEVMPELGLKYGYYMALLLMVGSVLFLWWLLRRKNWF
ncbi:magnesium and cobalt transport protein CorA [Corynebacterium antarcticum]